MTQLLTSSHGESGITRTASIISEIIDVED